MSGSKGCWTAELLLLFSGSVVSDSLQPHGLQHARLPVTPSPRACSHSRPLNQGCHPTISSSVVPFSCLQSSNTMGSKCCWVARKMGSEAHSSSILHSCSAPHETISSLEMETVSLWLFTSSCIHPVPLVQCVTSIQN